MTIRKLTIRGFVLPVAVVLIGAAGGPVVMSAPQQFAALPAPGFHHLHMNSANPSAAINEFLKIYPASNRVTVAGFDGLKTANSVYMLFTKVNMAPPAPGPDRVTAQTAFWHHVWAAKDARAALSALRHADPRFDMTKFIPQYTGPEGGTVDLSSDSLSGFLTTKELEAAKQRGSQPTHRGGYFNWYGPDGVVMETTDGPEERYTIVGMFQEQPYCALSWYKTHLNAPDRPAGRGDSTTGRPSAGPTSDADCKVSRGTDVSWPSTYKRGHHRIPSPQLVVFDDVTLRWYMNQQDRPLVSTRGQLMDHIALSVDNLESWVSKLKSENVRFLMPPYRLGDTRAAMIEGPSLEAIELVEKRP